MQRKSKWKPKPNKNIIGTKAQDVHAPLGK